MWKSSQTYAVRVGAALDHDLLPAQREAVTFRGGPLLVLGGAGTGKTTVIESAFRWFVELGCQPERLARADARRRPAPTRCASGSRARSSAATSSCTSSDPVELAGLVLGEAGAEALDSMLGPGDRLAMLLERIDELELEHHDFGGSANALLGGFVRRIDRLKAELIGAEDYAAWAQGVLDPGASGARARVRGGVPGPRADARRGGRARRRRRGARARCAAPPSGAGGGRGFDHLLIDDAQELDLAAARLALAVGGRDLTAAGDPMQALRRFRGAGEARIRQFELREPRVVRLERSLRCPSRVLAAARAAVGASVAAVRLRRRSRAARSSSGGARTIAPRRSRWPPTSSG